MSLTYSSRHLFINQTKSKLSVSLQLINHKHKHQLSKLEPILKINPKSHQQLKFIKFYLIKWELEVDLR